MIKICPFMLGDESKVLSLFEDCFSKSLASELWRWRFKDNSHGEAIIELAWDNEVLAGHYAISKCNLSICNEDVSSGLSGTTMTHPTYRGLGLFPKLAGSTYDQMRKEKMVAVWGFPNVNSHRGFVKDLKWKNIYEIPTFRMIISDASACSNVSDNVREMSTIDERFDILWHKAKQHYNIISKRDSAHLKWRYLDHPDIQHRLLVFINQEEILGYVVFKKYGNELQILDILTINNWEIGRALMQNVINIAVKDKCDAVSLWLNVTDPLHLVLEQFGFRNSTPITYFGGLVLNSPGNNVDFYDYRSWYFSMGDSDVY